MCDLRPSSAASLKLLLGIPAWQVLVVSQHHIFHDNKHLRSAKTLSGASASVPKTVFPLVGEAVNRCQWGRMKGGVKGKENPWVGRDELQKLDAAPP